MNPELEALLIVQQHDEAIRAIEARRDAFAPRLVSLDKARKRAVDEVARNEAALAREELRGASRLLAGDVVAQVLGRPTAQMEA